MANRTWQGGDTAVAQVDTQTYGGTWEADDVVIYTLKDESGTSASISTTTGSTTIATITATVAAALNASTDPRFRAITWAAGSTTVTGTADTAGVPFHLTVSTTEAGGGGADAQTLSNATTTPNQGPNDYGDAGNWVESAVPVASDKVTIAGSNDILYSLDQSGVTLSGFVIAPDCTAQVGASGAPLKIASSADVLIGGGGTYYLDLGSSNVSARFVSDDLPRDTTLNFATETVDLSNYPFTNIKGSNLATFYIEDGRVEVARSSGVTATVATINLSGGLLRVGSGATLTTLNVAGGAAYLAAAATTVKVNRGVVTTSGSGAVTTMTVAGGVVYPNSTGTISTLTVLDAGIADFTNSLASRTVSTLNVFGQEATVAYDPGAVTISASNLMGGATTQGPQS